MKKHDNNLGNNGVTCFTAEQLMSFAESWSQWSPGNDFFYLIQVVYCFYKLNELCSRDLMVWAGCSLGANLARFCAVA